MPTADVQEQNRNLRVSEIFDSICACLSDNVIAALHDDVETSFAQWHIPGRLRGEAVNSCTRYFLEGTLADVLAAEAILKKELQLSLQQIETNEIIAEEDGSEREHNSDPETTLVVELLAAADAPSDLNCSQLEGQFQVHAPADGHQPIENGQSRDSDTAVPLPDPVVIEIHRSRLEGALPSVDVAPACPLETGIQRRKKHYEEVTPFKYFCDLCSFKTKRNSHYVKHMKIHEKVATVHRCSGCPFTTVRLGHLRRHQATHSSVLQRCSRCSYATDNHKLLLRHIRVKHRRAQCSRGTPAQVLECPHCSYRTTRSQMLARHKRRHLGEGSSPQGAALHQCEQCCYKTRRKEHLVRHRNNVHGEARPFLCHQCGKAFKRGDALRQHHLTHGDGPPREASHSFPCPQCPKTFRTQSHLAEHEATHSTARPFLCEVCGAAFKTRSVQRKHVQSVHRNPRAFSCQACSKKFNTQYALKRHQKLHAEASGNRDGEVVAAEGGLPPEDVLVPSTVATIPETCGFVGHVPSAVLQPVETATLLYLTGPHF